MSIDLLQKHIKNINDNYESFICFDQRKHLQDLKKSGVEPLIIYDIGAGALTWTKYAQKLWPNTLFVVFDAFEPFSQLYEKMKIQHHIGVLSNNDPNNKIVKFYQNEFFFFENSYYCDIVCEQVGKFDLGIYSELPTETLDQVVERKEFPWPDLININVQGAEQDVLEGAQECLSKCDHLIVTMCHEKIKWNAPRVYTILPYICSLGWKCDAPFFSDYGGYGDYGFTKNNKITY